jgi:plasmid maintenance system antidote protein VapI
MNIKEAVTAALLRRYGGIHADPVRQRKTPVSQPAGQQGRLGDLVTAFKGDRIKAAAAIGVPRDTLTRWINGKRGVSKASQGKLEAAYQRHIVKPRQARADNSARRKHVEANPAQVDARVKVTATIRWSNSDKKKYNSNSHRTTTLPLINLQPIVTAWLRGHDPGEAFEKEATFQGKLKYPKNAIRFEGNSVEVEFLT